MREIGSAAVMCAMTTISSATEKFPVGKPAGQGEKL